MFYLIIMQFVLGIGLINCFLNRAFDVCSNWSLFHHENSILKNIFHRNGHKIFDNCVNKFLKNKLNSKAKDKNSNNENNRCTTFPYIGNASLVFKKLLSPRLKELIIIVIFILDHLRFIIIFNRRM